MSRISSAPPQSTNGVAKSKTAKANRILPSVRLASANHRDIMRTFANAGHSGNPVTTAEIGKITGLKPDTVGLTIPFFVNVGLLTRTEAGLVPCAELLSLTRAFEWQPETAFFKIGPVLQKTWFAQMLVPRLQLRPRPEGEVLTELADAAEVGKEAKPQLKLLLEYLEMAGIVARGDDGMVRINKLNDDQAERSADSLAEDASGQKSSSLTTTFESSSGNRIQLSFSIDVDGTEMGNWKPERIAAFMSGIAQVLAAKGALEKQEATG